MLLQSHPRTFSLPRTHPRHNLHASPAKFFRPTCSIHIGLHDVAQILHNKVLVAAVVSSAIGQLAKPFTSVLLYGRDLDFRTTVQAGGFPSSHSSCVVAAATSLAIERGFSDSIFGLTVVYAGLVMYDAQMIDVSLRWVCKEEPSISHILKRNAGGVRREAGNHARVLNRLLLPKSQANINFPGDRNETKPTSASLKTCSSLSTKESNALATKMTNAKLLLHSHQEVKESEGSEGCRNDLLPLKESIGHTEFEVAAGALLGFLVSVAVHALL